MNRKRGTVKITTSLLGVLALTALAPLDRALAQETPGPWLPFRSLVGEWEGGGEGFGATSVVSHRWDFVINDSFLRLRTRSVSTAADGAQEVHEDVGYLSFDADNQRFVFRQFLSEGYVNTYNVTLDGNQQEIMEFAYRDAESAGGMRARLHIVFFGSDEYEMVLDLANPGENFVACQTMRMKKVK